jgi:hypothetical protein
MENGHGVQGGDGGFEDFPALPSIRVMKTHPVPGARERPDAGCAERRPSVDDGPDFILKFSADVRMKNNVFVQSA